MPDEFQRVKDKTTGHKFSVRHPDLEKVDVIDEPAVDREGKPLLAEPAGVEPSVAPPVDLATPKTSVKSAEQKTPIIGAEPAATPKEGSA